MELVVNLGLNLRSQCYQSYAKGNYATEVCVHPVCVRACVHPDLLSS